MLLCSLLDTGTSTSILSNNITKELNLEITPADRIALRAANGEEMNINGLSLLWLHIYEGQYEGNKPLTKNLVEVVIMSLWMGMKSC